MADGEAQIEFLLFVVDEKDCENLKWDNSIREVCNLLEQFIEIENGRDFVIVLDQRRYKS